MDELSSHIFTSAVAVVFMVVEFFTTPAAVAVGVFRCSTTAVAVIGCEEYENKSANNYSILASLFNLKLNFSTFVDIYHWIILSFTVLLISLCK